MGQTPGPLEAQQMERLASLLGEAGPPDGPWIRRVPQGPLPLSGRDLVSESKQGAQTKLSDQLAR